MSDRSSTRERILDASRRLFNQKGYANATLAEIAADVGIAEGNLWYHFRTKRDLVRALEEELRAASRERRAAYPSDRSVADDYVECVLSSISQSWAYRFLLRDYLQFSGRRDALKRDPDLAADFDMLAEALRRMKKDGMFRRDLEVDLESLTRSVWMVTRYWADHLQEHDGLDDVAWKDQERGVQLHFAVLLPHLTAAARRELEAALVRVSGQLAAKEAS